MIDADYRGQVKVLLFNHGEGEYRVGEGERVAQLVLERVGFFCFLFLGSLFAGLKLTVEG